MKSCVLQVEGMVDSVVLDLSSHHRLNPTPHLQQMPQKGRTPPQEYSLLQWNRITIGTTLHSSSSQLSINNNLPLAIAYYVTAYNISMILCIPPNVYT